MNLGRRVELVFDDADDYGMFTDLRLRTDKKLFRKVREIEVAIQKTKSRLALDDVRPGSVAIGVNLV